MPKKPSRPTVDAEVFVFEADCKGFLVRPAFVAVTPEGKFDIWNMTNRDLTVSGAAIGRKKIKPMSKGTVRAKGEMGAYPYEVYVEAKPRARGTLAQGESSPWIIIRA